MIAEASFFSLNSTAWTAIGAFATLLGTLAALAIALGLIDAIRTWFRRPQLTFRYDQCAQFSSEVNNAFWLRVPVEGRASKRSAKNVEIFLEAASKVTQGGSNRINGFVPMRLKWCNTEKPVCESIPAGSFRLLNVGYVQLQPQIQNVGGDLLVAFPSFVFAGEVATEAHTPLAMGVFELVLSITADGVPKTVVKARVVIRKPNENLGQPAKIERG